MTVKVQFKRLNYFSHGHLRYLYRAIEADGHKLDIWLRKKRDNHSAYAFIKRLVDI
jgi:transposase-like protein